MNTACGFYTKYFFFNWSVITKQKYCTYICGKITAVIISAYIYIFVT